MSLLKDGRRLRDGEEGVTVYRTRSCRVAVYLTLALALTVTLAACGKKGAPQPPSGEPNTYPKVYPSE
jgi:hypothetical protein